MNDIPNTDHLPQTVTIRGETIPIAWALLGQQHTTDFTPPIQVWVIQRCPYCGKRHTHGAGKLREDPRRYVGERGRHCTTRLGPDDLATEYVVLPLPGQFAEVRAEAPTEAPAEPERLLTRGIERNRAVTRPDELSGAIEVCSAECSASAQEPHRWGGTRRRLVMTAVGVRWRVRKLGALVKALGHLWTKIRRSRR